jgi:hypothetical protein
MPAAHYSGRRLCLFQEGPVQKPTSSFIADSEAEIAGTGILVGGNKPFVSHRLSAKAVLGIPSKAGSVSEKGDVNARTELHPGF